MILINFNQICFIQFFIQFDSIFNSNILHYLYTKKNRHYYSLTININHYNLPLNFTLHLGGL